MEQSKKNILLAAGIALLLLALIAGTFQVKEMSNGNGGFFGLGEEIPNNPSLDVGDITVENFLAREKSDALENPDHPLHDYYDSVSREPTEEEAKEIMGDNYDHPYQRNLILDLIRADNLQERGEVGESIVVSTGEVVTKNKNNDNVMAYGPEYNVINGADITPNSYASLTKDVTPMDEIPSYVEDDRHILVFYGPVKYRDVELRYKARNDPLRPLIFQFELMAKEDGTVSPLSASRIVLKIGDKVYPQSVPPSVYFAPFRDKMTTMDRVRLDAHFMVSSEDIGVDKIYEITVLPHETLSITNTWKVKGWDID